MANDSEQMLGKALIPAPLPVEEKAFIRSQAPYFRTESAQRTVNFNVPTETYTQDLPIIFLLCLIGTSTANGATTKKGT